MHTYTFFIESWYSSKILWWYLNKIIKFNTANKEYSPIEIEDYYYTKKKFSKAIYSYIPDIIEFYTGEKAILRNVPTWRCGDKDSLKYVLENLADLVVKEVHGSGGYGMLIGPTSTKKDLQTFKRKLRARPRHYIAQPTLSLSTVPIFTKSGLAPRHVDLRPFVLVSPNRIDITPGGLTRVALKKGSLVVNSSQGGGTKDTWVLED